MRKQDTAALNTHALVARVEELAIKQYWLARKLDVTTRTVNRWMTGKVKRISRDNLDRMVEVLHSSHEALTTADEGDVFATRSEQTKAANLLVSRETENLFIASQRFEAYEQLLKATLHPDLTLQQLAVMYNQLLIVCAKQRKFDDGRLAAERCIDYASRCGDIAHETSARTSLAIIDAEQGKLADARRKMEYLIDLTESVGAGMRHRCNIMLNLGTVYRFLGEMKLSAEMANQTLEHHAEHARPEFTATALKAAALLARDTGKYAESQRYFAAAAQIFTAQANARDLAEMLLFQLELRSLLGERGLLSELALAMRSLAQFTYFGDNHFVAAAGVCRRCGDFQAATQYVEEGLAASSTRRYEIGLLQHEQARIWQSAGKAAKAERALAAANEIYRSCGMLKRVCDDPALDIAEPFSKAAARVKLLWPDLPQVQLA